MEHPGKTHIGSGDADLGLGAGPDDPTPLRAIFVEDNPDEARLMARELRLAGFEIDWQRVDLEEQFVASLDETTQVVLCDSGLPAFDAFRALAILQERDHPAPMVIVTGTVGEDVAVEALRRGAADYVMKDRLARLGRAVWHALDRALAEKAHTVASVAREEQRRRIAVDIYDGAVQGFSALAILLEALGRNHPDIREDERFVAAQRAVADSITKIHALLVEPHPGTHDEPSPGGH
jgi:DNA-binding response OmpR family regulator